jgi:hypothetical protein
MRMIHCTYVGVEPFHLHCLDKEAICFNNRNMCDAERCRMALARIASKRVTYQKLIGKGPVAEEAGGA